MNTTRRTTRRTFLGAVAGTAAGLGLGVRPAAAQEGLAAWFENTSNAGEVVDRRGESSVTVTVGAEANGGAFGYGPAAVRIDPGTTVVWEWNGKGGSHNVVAEGGAFESELVDDSGHTFEHTFDSTGVYRYYCTPHRAMGMKGAVVVGGASTALGSGGSSSGGSDESSGDESSGDGSAATPTPTPDETATPTETATAGDVRFGGWLAETDNFESVVDRTGEDVVTVGVGAEGNGGRYAFDPPAVRIDPGTTVVFEWLTEQGPHGITAADGSFTAERVAQVGHRYAVRFDGEGVVKYECADHGDRGMRGAIVVGRGETNDLGPGGAALLVGGLVALGAAVTRFTPGDGDDDAADGRR